MGHTQADAIALVGPTASGKTTAALVLAQTLEKSRGGKSSAGIRPWSAARLTFARDAARLLGETYARSKTPLIVGGTMRYL